MKVRFKASFGRDLQALKDKGLLVRIKTPIANVEAAQSLAEVSGLKKLRGSCTKRVAETSGFEVGGSPPMDNEKPRTLRTGPRYLLREWWGLREGFPNITDQLTMVNSPERK